MHDYRWQVALACVVPLFLVLVAGLAYLCRNKDLKNDPHVRRKNINQLFDTVDVDKSGSINVDEFQRLLRAMHQPTTAKETMLAQMNQIGATQQHRQTVLARAAFVEAAMSKQLNLILGANWEREVAANRDRSSRLSTVLILLFLMHAPVSQRLFYYFSCHQVGDKEYLVQDYSMPCGETDHLTFAPFVVFMLVVFTFGLPLLVLGLLFRYRKSLYNPKVHAIMGFLYARFHKGSEFWEIHEVGR
jgi:hypothetical protein